MAKGSSPSLSPPVTKIIQQVVVPFVILCGCAYYGYLNKIVLDVAGNILYYTVAYNVIQFLFFYFNIHKYGPWKCAEPKEHFIFSLKSSWIVVLWALQNKLVLHMFGMSVDDRGDAHHHNQIFISPLTTAMSPLVHFATFATFLPVVALGMLGLHKASVIAYGITMLPNVTQHLGFDPFPWLTRANHYYFYGALPWIPLYHSYHHNPFIAAGNFGNTTVLFDYVYGTLQHECIYHIENGEMMEKLQDRFKDEKQLGKVLDGIYRGGGGKNRFDLNDQYDWSIFQTYMM